MFIGHWSRILNMLTDDTERQIDDNIFCPLISVLIANYCRGYSMNRVSCDGSFTMHRPFTNHRSFTIAAFSRGPGASSSTENVHASNRDKILVWTL